MVIEADGLSLAYGRQLAVDGVSFRVNRGEVVGFLGPNGAGKSTTLRMLAGLIRPDGGSARVAGHDSSRSRMAAQARLGYMPEAASGFSDLTVAEFLAYCAEARGFHGRRRRAMIADVADRTMLAPALGTRLRKLSKGWCQRAWFAQAVMHGPPALILDEPTDGLDPEQKEHIRALVRELSKDAGILLTTHILEEAEFLSDRIFVLVGGRLQADRPVADLLDARGRLAPAYSDLVRDAVREPG